MGVNSTEPTPHHATPDRSPSDVNEHHDIPSDRVPYGQTNSWASESPLKFQPRLHPSFTPKCTHAYAVSRAGAARLVRHLRSVSHYPKTNDWYDQEGPSGEGDSSEEAQGNDSLPDCTYDDSETTRCRHSSSLAFAYGRALDQALVRLIQGRRISAFSVVPSVIIQTKDGPSDIMPGSNGSTWKDVLNDSALARLEVAMREKGFDR